MRSARAMASDVWGVIGRALGWMRVRGDGDASGLVQVEGVGSNDEDAGEEEREGRDDVEHCALLGFGSVAESGDLVLVLRRDDGGVSIAAYTVPPTDSVKGDRYITHKDGHLFRLTRDRAVKRVEIKNATEILLGSDLMPVYVARHGDDVPIDTTLRDHVHVCSPPGNNSGPPIPGILGTGFLTSAGTVSASTTTVKAG